MCVRLCALNIFINNKRILLKEGRMYSFTRTRQPKTGTMEAEEIQLYQDIALVDMPPDTYYA